MKKKRPYVKKGWTMMKDLHTADVHASAGRLASPRVFKVRLVVDGDCRLRAAGVVPAKRPGKRDDTIETIQRLRKRHVENARERVRKRFIARER